MKNAKVRAKLAMIMVFTLAMFAITVVSAVISLGNTSRELDIFYTSPYHVRAAARQLDTAVEGLVKSVLRVAITSDASVRQDALADIDEYLAEADECVKIIKERYLGDKQTVDELAAELALLAADREKTLDMALKGALPQDVSKYIEANNLQRIAKVEGYIDQIVHFANDKGETMINDIRNDQERTMLLMVVLGVVGIVVSIALGLVISRSITAPLARITKLMDRAGSTGDIYLSDEEQAMIRGHMRNKDEISQSILAFKRLTDHITAMADALERVAAKDLSVDIVTLSDRDALGRSIAQMQLSLSRMFGEMQLSTTQISIASGQIAGGAQALAQGVTEQSSVIEELSASLMQISKQTDTNVELAERAKGMGIEIKNNAEQGSEQMRQLMKAMDEISTANKSISKIVGLIEDISFQTNILSLNAAIEAARAGEHGKGFAVIVGAVRELAAKSAQAADTIKQLVRTSTEKSDSGAAISLKTDKAMGAILESTLTNVDRVTQIAQASGEQAAALSQVVIGIDQVAEVVHRNSATAEQSAAASEEMSRQAHQLREYLGEFKIKNML